MHCLGTVLGIWNADWMLAPFPHWLAADFTGYSPYRQSWVTSTGPFNVGAQSQERKNP